MAAVRGERADATARRARARLARTEPAMIGVKLSFFSMTVVVVFVVVVETPSEPWVPCVTTMHLPDASKAADAHTTTHLNRSPSATLS